MIPRRANYRHVTWRSPRGQRTAHKATSPMPVSGGNVVAPPSRTGRPLCEGPNTYSYCYRGTPERRNGLLNPACAYEGFHPHAHATEQPREALIACLVPFYVEGARAPKPSTQISIVDQIEGRAQPSLAIGHVIRRPFHDSP